MVPPVHSYTQRPAEQRCEDVLLNLYKKHTCCVTWLTVRSVRQYGMDRHSRLLNPVEPRGLSIRSLWSWVQHHRQSLKWIEHIPCVRNRWKRYNTASMSSETGEIPKYTSVAFQRWLVHSPLTTNRDCVELLRFNKQPELFNKLTVDPY